MPRGKSDSQAAHAARLSLLTFLKNTDRAHEFMDRCLAHGSIGSIVTLTAPDLGCLQALAAKANADGLPWALFVDRDHVCPPSFDGSPIITALAVGPALKTQVKPLFRKLKCFTNKTTGDLA
jgi:PTH2 family peptidyl-tRNA hydrolase